MIYFDVCCLYRPFDDQTQERIRLESEAVLAILFGCERGKWYLVSSEVIEYEVALAPDLEKREKVITITSLAHDKINIDAKVKKRANYLASLGFNSFDALHLACAESFFVEVLLTTDDKFLNKAIKNKSKLKVRVENPVLWLMEVTRNAGSDDES